MEGHSRSGAFGEDAGSECDDPFGRMRNFGSLGRGADMFSHPSWGGFAAHGAPADSWPMDDPMDGVESMRPRQRPKFSSATTMMGPRPFRRERRASAGPSEQPAADGGQPGRERIIPIRVERDETDSAAAQQQQQQQQPPAQQQPSPRQQRPYVRRGTMDTPVSSLQTEELQRDARARSAPPEAEPKAAAARVPPLNMQAAAAAAAGPHKPNYFNSSPKPFSAQQRPFQTPSFGTQGQIPIPVKVERGAGQQQHPHQHQQQQHQQQQQEPDEPKQPPPPPPKPKSPKERAMETIAAVQERVDELGCEVESFTGQRGEKQHLYLDEMLTRELLKLDNVEANGDEEIRTSRKQTIMSIQKCLARLEAKVTTPEEVAAKAAQAQAEAGGEAESPAMETEEAQPAAEGTEGAGEVQMKSEGEAAQLPAAETEPTETAPPPPPQEAAAPPDPVPAVPDDVSAPAQETAPAPAPAAGPEGDTTPAPATEAAPAPETPAAEPAPEAAAAAAAQS